MALLPAGTRLLGGSEQERPPAIPRVVLRWADRVAYEEDPSDALCEVTNRVCLELMRQGYEIKESVTPTTVDSAPRHVGPPPNGKRRRWGNPGDNGGPIDEDEE